MLKKHMDIVEFGCFLLFLHQRTELRRKNLKTGIGVEVIERLKIRVI